jgi:hypothetical protein
VACACVDRGHESGQVQRLFFRAWREVLTSNQHEAGDLIQIVLVCVSLSLSPPLSLSLFLSLCACASVSVCVCVHTRARALTHPHTLPHTHRFSGSAVELSPWLAQTQDRQGSVCMHSHEYVFMCIYAFT